MTKGRKRNRIRTERPTTRAGRVFEREDKIMGVALAQPHRRGNRSQRAGFVLGRLSISGEISEEQFQAGERYTTLASRHMRHVLGCSYHWPTTSLANSVGGAMSLGSGETDTEELERQWNDAASCLAEHGLLTSGVRALARICLMDLEPDRDQLGDARLALNALYRMWSRETKRRVHTIADEAA